MEREGLLSPFQKVVNEMCTFLGPIMDICCILKWYNFYGERTDCLEKFLPKPVPIPT